MVAEEAKVALVAELADVAKVALVAALALVADEAKVALVAEPLMFIDWPLINVATVAADAERK